ncbi:uncharacterized protein BDR25DRAFT_287341 [Lindgomyces ingoldianus]|uniref:Uncharacterized protein n=1 Tax=Lindgomyces ingoldianus TaxID=673940 RepID=A0ACB6QU87_9PLEO|nr:uncharacterized protein BDR25DRAFT_287341 [Lindgomyces ingoldianus]KAF2470417.1 hypothetical protein BDR25DRAFT_287341 [Lindgomyces ingoldianus]
MAAPPFAGFPQADVRRKILPREWELYLRSCTSLSELYLRFNNEDFSSTLTETGSLPLFLISFFNALTDDNTLGSSINTLRKKCFLLIHRIYSGNKIPLALLSWTTLADICHAFPRSDQLRSLLQSLWKRRSSDIEKGLQMVKASLIKTLDSNKSKDAEDLLNKLGPLFKASSDAAMFMLTGSDFLDSLCNVYSKVSPHTQKKLVATTYLGLTALLDGPKPNYSLLSDHLYSIKASAEQEQKSNTTKTTFLTDLVTNTPFLNKIRDSTTNAEDARVKNIAVSLSVFRQSSTARPKKLIRRKVNKGKGKAKDDEYGHGAFGDVHVHRMSLVSQIQDLFADLGSGFVVKLLDEYNDNVEEVTAHLLEDSLPPRLADANRSEQLPTTASSSHPHLTPRFTPPLLPQRRNVFDNDDFDKLAVDTSRLHIGRKNEELTADNILSDRSNAPNKSAILAALAAFDSDDDERDDTYDVEDVGGTVDSAISGADEVDAGLRDKNEEALFRAYSTTPELFGRDAGTRRGKARAGLKSETGMTDEAIEGWGVMIGRDPRRLRRLEAKFSTFSGQQRELGSTAYRTSPAESGEEASGDGQRGSRGGFSGRGRPRGRGRGGGRGGGNVAGPSEDKSTQVSRNRKEANKGSRANHNRRDQRARKVARAGFPG